MGKESKAGLVSERRKRIKGGDIMKRIRSWSKNVQMGLNGKLQVCVIGTRCSDGVRIITRQVTIKGNVATTSDGVQYKLVGARISGRDQD
jgi:hypothetical protein